MHRHRLRLVAAVALVLLVVGLVASTLAATDALARDRERADRLAASMLAVERLDAAFLAQQTALRGYVISGEPALLGQLRGAAPAIAEAVGRIGESAGDDPVAAYAIAQVGALHRLWSDRADLIVGARARGDVEAAHRAVPGLGAPVFAQLVERVQDLRSSVGRLARQAQADTAATSWLLVLCGSASAAVGGVLVVGAAVGLHRAVLRPLRAVVDAARAVDAGDWERDIPCGGPEEVALVGVAVSDMRDQLRDQAERRAQEAEKLARAGEAGRDAEEVRRTAAGRLIAVSSSLRSTAHAHASVARDLGPVLDDLDDVAVLLRGRPVVGRPRADT